MIEIVHGISGLRKLEGEWIRLGALFPTPLVQYDWFLSCAETLYAEADLRVVVVRSGDRVTAIAPLVLVRKALTRWLEIIGASVHYEPCGLLYEDPRLLQELLDGVLRLGYPVHLARIPAASPIRPAMRQRKTVRAVVLVRESAGSCCVEFNSDWNTFFGSIRPNRRTDFRRTQRLAEAIGEVSMDIFCPDVDKLDQHLDQAIRIEAACWKGRAGSSLQDNEPLRTFFRNYAGKACGNGTLRICFYRINGAAISMHIGVEHARRLWIIKIGYDDSWRKISPGMLLAHQTIRYACEKGLEGYEFLGSDEPWQHEWPVRTHEYCSIVVYTPSLRGIMGMVDTMIAYTRNRMAAKK